MGTIGVKQVVSIVGRIDIEAHNAFTEVYACFRNADVSEIELDCSGITYCNSSGIGMFLILKEKAAVRGKRISIVKPSSVAKLQFDMANLGRLIRIS